MSTAPVIKKVLEQYTRKEVAKHNTEEDGLFIFGEYVYNATPHLQEIKMLKTSTYLAIMRVLGTDCTDEMNEIMHSPQALRSMEVFKVGELID